MQFLSYIKTWIIPLAFVLTKCTMDTSDKIERIVSNYEQKNITNSEMLLQLGELYYNNPDNDKVLKEYCYRMTISGYGSKVLTDIHAGRIKAGKSVLASITETAMVYDGLYELAPLYAQQHSDNAFLFQPYVKTYDSLKNLNRHIAAEGDADSYLARASFFRSLEKDKMAQYDFSRVEGLNPCKSELIFQKSIQFINEEAFFDLKKLLNNCGNNSAIDTSAWYQAFELLADTIIQLESLNLDNDDLMFKKAKIYIENNFPDIALEKVRSLIAKNPEVPDYHALEAFIYYRTHQKNKALASLQLAESLSNNKNTHLRKLIEAMP